MSKAVLVIDMPKSCKNCPLLFAGTYCKGKKAPNIAVNSYLDKAKPEWCPLKELPQKQTIHCTDTTHHRHVKEGYNLCIDEILKGSEENG